ncbi:TlpA disulfide reductase family protein [Ensifer adhaerens]|uniref:TlpA disulfide reductase family protein n=1 Tax=Ensifer adhaerens TaxID=106592 RepID=UPI003D082048
MTFAALHGRPVFLHTFQVLCPGCVAEANPQVKRIERVFAYTDLQLIGIHTVFEHHAAMSPVTLRAFLHEYRLNSPVGVDLAEDGPDIPVTMRRFGLRGTPSSVLIGRDGSILHHMFGVEDDIAVGARIATALSACVPEMEPAPVTEHLRT